MKTAIHGVFIAVLLNLTAIDQSTALAADTRCVPEPGRSFPGITLIGEAHNSRIQEARHESFYSDARQGKSLMGFEGCTSDSRGEHEQLATVGGAGFCLEQGDLYFLSVLLNFRDRIWAYFDQLEDDPKKVHLALAQDVVRLNRQTAYVPDLYVGIRPIILNSHYHSPGGRAVLESPTFNKDARDEISAVLDFSLRAEREGSGLQDWIEVHDEHAGRGLFSDKKFGTLVDQWILGLFAWISENMTEERWWKTRDVQIVSDLIKKVAVSSKAVASSEPSEASRFDKGGLSIVPLSRDAVKKITVDWRNQAFAKNIINTYCSKAVRPAGATDKPLSVTAIVGSDHLRGLYELLKAQLPKQVPIKIDNLNRLEGSGSEDDSED